MSTSIVKEEICIDDTQIKLEIDDESYDQPSIGTLRILEERSNMITVPVHDHQTEDELKFMEFMNSINKQQCSLFQTNDVSKAKPSSDVMTPWVGLYKCHLCPLDFESQNELDEHGEKHRENKHFCRHNCGIYVNSLEQCLDHEFRDHSGKRREVRCRLCYLVFRDMASLDIHVKAHAYMLRYVCALCRTIFETKNELQNHWAQSLGPCGQVNYKDQYCCELVSRNRNRNNVITVPPLLEIKQEIKEEPLDEPMDCDNNINEAIITEYQEQQQPISSIPNIPPKSKLRLPARKQAAPQSSVAPQPQPVLQPTTTLVSNIKLPQGLTIAKRGEAAITNLPPVQANTLQSLPSNIIVLKLPPNTKIVKLQKKVPSAADTPTDFDGIPATKIMRVVPTPIKQDATKQDAAGAGKTDRPETDKEFGVYCKKLLKEVEENHRNVCFSTEAFSIIDSLPESRKIIEAMKARIRFIEKSSPLPGSVLQPPKVSDAAKQLQQQMATSNLSWMCRLCGIVYKQLLTYRSHLITVHKISNDFVHEILIASSRYPPTSDEIKLPMKPDDNKVNAETVLTESQIKSEPNDSPPPTEHTTNTSNDNQQKEVEKRSSLDLTCDVCNKVFTTRGAVNTHKLIHTGELPHKCSYCDKRFRTPGQVRVHHRRHTGEKPFHCQICSLSFTHRETLISHLSRHIGMKRYKCYGCDKYFAVVSGLRAHLKLRPDTCGKVKFTARAHGPRVLVKRGQIYFEEHPETNRYLRSEDPLNILSQMKNQNKTEEEKVPQS